MQWQSKPSFTSHEYLMYQISIVINLEKLNVSGIVLSLSAFVKVIIINSATATVIFSFIPPQIPTVCLHAKSLQSCMTLCNPIDHSPPGSYVHGILLARILEWLPCPPPGNLPDRGIEPASLKSPALAGRLFTTSTTLEVLNTN